MDRSVVHRGVRSVLVTAAVILGAVLGHKLFDSMVRVAILSGIGAFYTVLVIWIVPVWQAQTARDLPKDTSRAQFENEARKTVAEVLGGMLLVLGIAATWLQLADGRQEQRDIAARAAVEQALIREEQQNASSRAATEQALTREGQLTDRFTAAVDQLGSSTLQVRLGGVFAPERIARDSPQDAPAVLEVLTAFVRESSPLPPPGAATPEPDLEGRYHPEEDVQAVLSVIKRGLWDTASVAHFPECLDLSRTDLRGARFRGTLVLKICLVDADLTGADLEGAYLIGAEMDGVDLEGANLRGANLVGADLRGADLEVAELGCSLLIRDEERCTNLSYASLDCRPLVGGQEQCTDLRGVQLSDVDLTNAWLMGANLGCVEVWSTTGPQTTCANLNGANLTDATLTNANLQGAYLEEATLTNADLSAANLRFAHMGHSDLSGADFSNADLSGADLSSAVFIDTDLSGANLTGAYVREGTEIDSAIWDENAPPIIVSEWQSTPAPMASPDP
jgi:uncharacterized protein YjbI with pentapeptide repeats